MPRGCILASCSRCVGNARVFFCRPQRTGALGLGYRERGTMPTDKEDAGTSNRTDIPAEQHLRRVGVIRQPIRTCVVTTASLCGKIGTVEASTRAQVSKKACAAANNAHRSMDLCPNGVCFALVRRGRQFPHRCGPHHRTTCSLRGHPLC